MIQALANRLTPERRSEIFDCRSFTEAYVLKMKGAKIMSTAVAEEKKKRS